MLTNVQISDQNLINYTFKSKFKQKLDVVLSISGYKMVNSIQMKTVFINLRLP
jgi:hypothetical protein